MRTILFIAGILALNTSSAFAEKHKNTMGNVESTEAVEVDDSGIPVTGAIPSRGALSSTSRKKTVSVEYLKGKDGRVSVTKQAGFKVKGIETNKSKLIKNAGGISAPKSALANYTNTNEDLGKGSRALLCGNGNNLRITSPITGFSTPTRRQPAGTVDVTTFTFPLSGTNVNVADAQGGAQNVQIISFGGQNVQTSFAMAKMDYYSVPPGEIVANGIRPTNLLIRNTGRAVNGCQEVVLLGGGGEGDADT